jgi:hypothetical protein
MNKVLSILIAAAFASASFGAMGADDPAKAARKQANDTYKADKKACEAMKGKEEKDCAKQAKAKHDQAINEVKAMKKTGKASSGSSTAPSSSGAAVAPSSSDTSRDAASGDKAAPATSGSSVK